MNKPKESETEPLKASEEKRARAFLEGLTGPSRGHVFWLTDDNLSASVGNDRVLRLSTNEAQSNAPDQVATLTWANDSYIVDAIGDQHVWVNGHQIKSMPLMHGDMIEFEDFGPMSRFRICDQSFPERWPVDEIMGDALAYAKSSRRPLPGRMSTAVRESLRRVIFQTTYAFRLTVIMILCAIVLVGILLYRNDQKIRTMLEQDARRIEAVTLLLSQTRDESMSEEDLTDLRRQVQTQLSRNAERLEALEERTQAASRIIAASAPSVAFVQGAFGLRHIDSGELLREVLGSDGKSLKTQFGQPRIEPFGNGPPAEFQFTGTGFLMENGQHLVTNRHVALPWTANDRLRAFEASGLAPEMLKLVAYFPDMRGPVSATLVNSSDTADLAVLSLAPLHIEGRGLSLSSQPPSAGDEIYLLGYPTGLKALLAQAGTAFLNDATKNSEIDFWSMAALLSDQNLINPLASGGIVAQASANAVVYDAETTVGGSGGPALNRFGEVVAVNAAILPEFGGSNIGVPISELDALLRGKSDQ